MAKKVTGYIKLQIPAGKATPAPPVGPALGQHGVNIVEFTKQFNAKTADQGDLIIPVLQFMLIEASALLQRLHLQQYFLRRLATLSQDQAYLTRLRLLLLREQKFRRSLSLRCQILTLHLSKQLLL